MQIISQLEQESAKVIELYGDSYQKTFNNINNSSYTTYTLSNLYIHKGCTLRVYYQSSVENLNCAFGVRFADNTIHNDIGRLLSSDSYIDYIAEKDVVSVSLYIATSVANIEYFTIVADVKGIVPDINALQQKTKLLNDNISLPYATSFLFSSMEIKVSNSKCLFKYSLTEGISAGYVHHTKGYLNVNKNIEKEFDLGTNIYIIYADGNEQDINVVNNYKQLPIENNICILEIFYCYEGNITVTEWTSPFISKNFISNTFNAFSNPSQINNIKTIVKGIEGSEIFNNVVAKTTMQMNFRGVTGQTLETWFECSESIYLIVGLNFMDGSQEYTLANLAPNQIFKYELTKDLANIAFYYAGDNTITEIILKAKVNSLQKEVKDLKSKSFKKATSLFYGTGEFVFNQTNLTIDVSFLRSIYDNVFYIYHEYGFTSVNKDIVKTLNYNDGLVIIYYNEDSKDIEITNSFAYLPNNCILFEVFYNYRGNVTRVSWTSPFINKNLDLDSGDFDTYSCYSNLKEIKNIKKSISELENQKVSLVTPKSVKIFQRVGCIGDSYTAGYIYTDNGLLNKSVNNSWPHYMEGLTNNKYDNWGVSGSTAKGWVLGAAGLNQVKAEGNKCQAYLIGLMINDRSNASWNNYYTPAGTIDDIGTDADSYYAYYYKLIQEVISVNPQAKIFCANNPKYGTNDAYNQAVNNIVNYCYNNNQNVFLVDLAGEYASYYQDFTFNADYINGHYTSIGYEYMAECYLVILSDIINKRVSDFQDVAYIPFDEVQ